MKKLIKISLVCTLMLMALCVTASAATEGYYTYEVSNGEAIITEVDTSISGDIIIPSTLGGYPVTIIGDDSFNSCRRLTSIEIPDGVTSLGDRAFMGCRVLTSVEMSDKITSIGENAFQSCESLTNIEIPDGVRTIGIYAFNQCYRLTSIEIPDGVTTIGDNMFSFCTGLTSIEIPDSVTTIGNMVFYRCGNLTSVEIPDSVTSIGDRAFYGCVNLKSITVVENNLQYSSKDGVLFDKNKTELIQYAPAKPESTYVVPDSVTSIGKDAFSNCSGLTNIEISHNVTTIGGSAFEGCTSLTGITVAENNFKFSSENGILFDKNKTELIQYTPGKIEEKYVVPCSVTTIGDGAFSYCKSLTSIEIPKSVTTIGWSAFSNCENLIGIDIPNSVTTIGGMAFSYCENLTNIEIPDSVITIGPEAFYNTIWYNNQPEGVVYAGKVLYSYKGEMPENTKVTIEEGTKSISGYAFEYCNGLISIEIPDSVTTIGESAFFDCSSLIDIEIPDNVTTISSSAFELCKNLTNIEIPDSVTNIGWRAFYNTNWYNNQPDGVVYAGKVLYSYKGEMPENTTIVVENGTKGIADYALKDCSGLKSVRINDGLITIGILAFYKCTGLKSIEIPDSVTTIGELAFRYCDAIESVYYNSDEITWEKIEIEYGNDKLLNNVLFLSKTVDVENPGEEPINIILIQYGSQSEPLNIVQNVVKDGGKEMVGIDVATEKYKILYWESLGNLKPVYEPMTKEFLD